MADRPILFSTPMVHALLAGTKTQTRRAIALRDPSAAVVDFVKVATDPATGRAVYEMKDVSGNHVTIYAGRHLRTPHYSPRIAVGDRLWVRETWGHTGDGVWTIADARSGLGGGKAIYAAEGRLPWAKYWPSIHMPREFSRLTLHVTDVRVQRLQDISPEDARDEGVDRRSRKVRQMWLFGADAAQREAIYLRACPWEYEDLWNSINGGGAWDANPWVVAYTFVVEQANIAKARAA
jgi:hypothetical protein